jgi:hypothetical protein
MNGRGAESDFKVQVERKNIRQGGDNVYFIRGQFMKEMREKNCLTILQHSGNAYKRCLFLWEGQCLVSVIS